MQDRRIEAGCCIKVAEVDDSRHYTFRWCISGPGQCHFTHSQLPVHLSYHVIPW